MTYKHRADTTTHTQTRTYNYLFYYYNKAERRIGSLIVKVVDLQHCRGFNQSLTQAFRLCHMTRFFTQYESHSFRMKDTPHPSPLGSEDLYEHWYLTLNL